MAHPVYLIIRNDDLCALSDLDHERRVLAVFEKYGLKQVFGVIPRMCRDPHDHTGDTFYPLPDNPQVVEFLKQARDSGLVEMAQHGFIHQTNAAYPSRAGDRKPSDYRQGFGQAWQGFNPERPEGYSEFNTMPVDEIRRRIQTGKQELEAALGCDLETFIFPWDSVSPESLAAVRDCGYTNLLTGEWTFATPGLRIIQYCEGDMSRFPQWLKSVEKINCPVVTQIAYHSWMVDDAEMVRLEELLKFIHDHPRVQVVTASELTETYPDLQAITDAKLTLDERMTEVNRHLGRKMPLPKFYALDKNFYRRQGLKVFLKGCFVRYGGYRNLVIVWAALLTIFMWLIGGPGRLVSGGNGVAAAGFLLSGMWLVYKNFRVAWLLKR